MTILQFFLWSLLKVAVVTVVMLLGVAYTVLLERKLVGRIQNRWGPSRVGPFGLLQPLVDGAKSFLKEDIIPSGVYRPLYLLAPILALGCTLISIAVVPFGEPGAGPGRFDLFEISDLNIGLLVILGVTSIGVYGIALAGGRRTTSIRCSGRCAPRRNWSATNWRWACRWWAWCCAPGRST